MVNMQTSSLFSRLPIASGLPGSVTTAITRTLRQKGQNIHDEAMAVYHVRNDTKKPTVPAKPVDEIIKDEPSDKDGKPSVMLHEIINPILLEMLKNHTGDVSFVIRRPIDSFFSSLRTNNYEATAKILLQDGSNTPLKVWDTDKEFIREELKTVLEGLHLLEGYLGDNSTRKPKLSLIDTSLIDEHLFDGSDDIRLNGQIFQHKSIDPQNPESYQHIIYYNSETRPKGEVRFMEGKELLKVDDDDEGSVEHSYKCLKKNALQKEGVEVASPEKTEKQEAKMSSVLQNLSKMTDIEYQPEWSDKPLNSAQMLELANEKYLRIRKLASNILHTSVAYDGENKESFANKETVRLELYGK